MTLSQQQQDSLFAVYQAYAGQNFADPQLQVRYLFNLLLKDAPTQAAEVQRWCANVRDQQTAVEAGLEDELTARRQAIQATVTTIDAITTAVAKPAVTETVLA